MTLMNLWYLLDNGVDFPDDTPFVFQISVSVNSAEKNHNIICFCFHALWPFNTFNVISGRVLLLYQTLSGSLPIHGLHSFTSN